MRTLHCKNCNVQTSFISVIRNRRVNLNGAIGVYDVDLMSCIDCDYEVEALNQRYSNNENKMIAEQGLIIDENILNGGDL